MVIEQSHHTNYPGAITLPITTEYRRAAQHFAAQCPFAEKMPQIERNTLAVCAVNAYLRMMDIDTDVAASDSWNPMMQMMADVADLSVPGVGALSCRAMGPGAETCYVPPEDWIDRAGYVAVILDETENKAILVGFVQTVDEEEQVAILQGSGMAIARFAPIETLLDHIHALKAEVQPKPLTDTLQTTLTRISQWFEDSLIRGASGLANGWQAVDELLNPPQAGFAFRSADTTRNSNLSAANNVSRAKAIRLESTSTEQATEIALVLQIRQVSLDYSDIIVQVHPLRNSARLPAGISLSIFDDGNNLVRNAISRAIDDYIQLQVAGEPEELFSIQIRKEDAIFEEQFEI